MTEQTDTSSAPTAPAYDLSSLGAVLCVPTYGPVDPLCARSVRLAVMFAANKGLKWHGDVSPDRLGYGAARITSVQFTLTEQPEADGIMWVDSDIKTPLWGIARLLDTVIGGNMDFASGVYHQRSPIHTPIFYHYNEDLKLFQPADDYPPYYIGNADGCGFGFCWTSSNMLRAMSKHPSFTSSGGLFPDRRDRFIHQVLQESQKGLYSHTGIFFRMSGVFKRRTLLMNMIAFFQSFRFTIHIHSWSTSSDQS